MGGRYALQVKWIGSWKVKTPVVRYCMRATPGLRRGQDFDRFIRSKLTMECHRHKFDTEEYILRRADSKEPIPRYSDFLSSFEPGVHVQMSVIFPNYSAWRCPKCDHRLSEDAREQIW